MLTSKHDCKEINKSGGGFFKAANNGHLSRDLMNRDGESNQERREDEQNNSDQTCSFRETGVSRHQGGPIEGPPETPSTSQHYRTKELEV